MLGAIVSSRILRLYISRELPGWGRIYEKLVGDYKQNEKWASACPKVIIDKRYKLIRYLDIREWADRSFYFLKRWYDLPAQIIVDNLIGEGDHIIDIGANYGHFSLAASSRAGNEGRVYAYEPNPSAVDRLKLHVTTNKLENVAIRASGLSDEPGSLILHIPHINCGEATFSGQIYDLSTEISCKIETLDTQSFEARIAFVKIDVEGFESRVLRGGESLIKSDRPIILTEIIDVHLKRSSSSFDDLYAFFKRHNYSYHWVSTKRKGQSHQLVLGKDGDAFIDGDYLWLPSERSQSIIAQLEEAA